MSLFNSTTLAGLNIEIDNLIGQILADTDICPECAEPHPWPFVDIDPARIPRTDARSQDRVALFLDRQPTTLLPSAQTRIAYPTPAVARHTAALLRGLGAPARAVYIGGTS